MALLTAELIPDKSGTNFTAEFTGRPNAVGLERALHITIYAAAVGAIEVAPVHDPESGEWEQTGESSVNGEYTMTKVPVCKAIRVASISAAATPPVRIFVRHGI